MAEILQMQGLLTLKGRRENSAPALARVVQPSPGWVDAGLHRDAAIRVNILKMEPSTQNTALKLHIQTAAAVAGPWKDLISYDGYTLPLPKEDVQGASTGAVGSGLELERFLRWCVDPSVVAEDTDWTICFEVWVTLK